MVFPVYTVSMCRVRTCRRDSHTNAFRISREVLIGRRGREGLVNRESFLTPFTPVLCVSLRHANGPIVLHRINYHLLSAAEARTKREAPVLAFWKRNLLVARCDPDADADATAVQCARDLHRDAANNGRHSETSRRCGARSYLLEIDFVEKRGEARHEKDRIRNIWSAPLFKFTLFRFIETPLP